MSHDGSLLHSLADQRSLEPHPLTLNETTVPRCVARRAIDCYITTRLRRLRGRCEARRSHPSTLDGRVWKEQPRTRLASDIAMTSPQEQSQLKNKVASRRTWLVRSGQPHLADD